MIKQIILICFTVLSFSNAVGQIADTTLYRQNKVKEIRSWVHVIGFEISNDTCLFSLTKVNERGQTTYQKIDYNCQGWDMLNEYYFNYDEKGRLKEVKTLQNNAVVQSAQLEMNELGQVVKEYVYFPETDMSPAGTTVTFHTYFGDAKYPDSTHTTQVVNYDTTKTVTTYTYLNNKIKKASTYMLSTRKPVSTQTNRYDQKMRLIRSEYIYFLGYDQDQITQYEYNNNDQVVETKSELDNLRAQFFYNRKGLPMLTHYYNKFESLEREMWHKYTYYE